MGKFLSQVHSGLIPYVPGEQPEDRSYIKLNTNESPFPPSPLAGIKINECVSRLNLYPDPECLILMKKLAEKYGIGIDMICVGNGSDEILSFLFNAFFADSGVVFPDITYGFYEVFAQLYRIPYKKIPLRDDFSIAPEDYMDCGRNIVLANPNAPTGMALSLSDIEKIVLSNREHVVVIDEAYVDFGGESAISLTFEYDNLIVVRTFSKSRSMAGVRLGFSAASKTLTEDMELMRYSTNPYNVSAMAQSAGIAALDDDEYYTKNCEKITATRDAAAENLRNMGFAVTPSSANFLFAKSDKVGGAELQAKLRRREILVRRFASERLSDYLRITVGSTVEMEQLISEMRDILKRV